MPKETGGPAFPGTEANYAREGEAGMTLRDYFAAKALQGMTTDGWQADERAGMAREAYKLADAMLAARSA